MDIIGRMASAEGDMGLDAALELLKSGGWNDRQLLDQYGIRSETDSGLMGDRMAE